MLNGARRAAIRSSPNSSASGVRSSSSSAAIDPRRSRAKLPISSPATSGVPVPAMAWASSLVTRSAAPDRVTEREYAKSVARSASGSASVKNVA